MKRKLREERMKKVGGYMKKFFQDFKSFATKGNFIDMAIGVVIGTAFNKIVSSFVADIITPCLGLVLGKVNFTELKIVFREAVEATETTPAVAELAMTYGNLLQYLIDFLIVAFTLFIVVRIMTKARENAEKRKAEKEAEEKAAAEAAAAEAAVAEAPAEPAPTKEELLLMEIRDLLAAKKD